MASIAELRQRLDGAAAIGDVLDRRLWVLSVITDSLLPLNVRPILVGGAAVEFYTLGGYATKDMDAVLSCEMDISSVMESLGFVRQGRFWLREDIGIAFETPPGPLAGDPERVTALSLADSTIYIIGIEDLIIDRLNAFVHWRSAEDGRWAERLLGENRDSLDMDYLRLRAQEQNVDQALGSMLS